MTLNTQQAYNAWASQYDTNDNKTRDLEAIALRKTLSALPFNNCLEIGCGIGKNTEWLIEQTNHVTAVDLSDEMLSRAKAKINSDKVHFVQDDITTEWTFTNKLFELITFSLVLEHIQNLDHIFNEAAKALVTGGHIYIGELHPYKQYVGSKARFETENGLQVVECFNHHISEFIRSAKKHKLILLDIDEYFDDNKHNELPRILSILFKKL